MFPCDTYYFCSLDFLDVLNEAALITALGASAFIVFTMPTQYSSDPRRLIGGYIVGLLVGFIFFLISSIFPESFLTYNLELDKVTIPHESYPRYSRRLIPSRTVFPRHMFF